MFWPFKNVTAKARRIGAELVPKKLALFGSGGDGGGGGVETNVYAR